MKKGFRKTALDFRKTALDFRKTAVSQTAVSGIRLLFNSTLNFIYFLFYFTFFLNAFLNE